MKNLGYAVTFLVLLAAPQNVQAERLKLLELRYFTGRGAVNGLGYLPGCLANTEYCSFICDNGQFTEPPNSRGITKTCYARWRCGEGPSEEDNWIEGAHINIDCRGK